MLLLSFVLSAGLSAADAAVPPPIYVLDLTGLHNLDRSDPAQARKAWDTLHMVASVQGIVNRDAPRLFVRFMPHPDDFWFEWLTHDGGWLGGREIRRLASPIEAMEVFADSLKGVVIYDEHVAATSNLASTMAGVEDRVCLRYDPATDSVCQQVLSSGRTFADDQTWLLHRNGSPLFTGEGMIPDTDIPSTGSTKCDAYLWAKAQYLDRGACSDDYLAFYIDAYWLQHPTESGFENCTLSNHDFFISQRAFFFDLHVWEEEAPVDDPQQKPGTDVATLHTLLRTAYDNNGGEILYIGGFTPWAWKYTDHGRAGGKHGGVDTEWKYAQIISTYNGIIDADALGYSGMSNASFYRHYPLRDRYPQNPRPDEAALREQGHVTADGAVAPKTYICFYMGDYDSAAWLNIHVPKWWQEPAHGDTLCTWAFNPNLDRRAPHALDYARTHQSRNDWFMFGDSGAGYLNPGGLIAPRASGLPDGLDAWVRHNRPYAERYDLSITGFIIDGHSKPMGDAGMDAYTQFSPDGIVGQKIPPVGVYRDRMPYIRMQMDLYGSPEDAGATIASLAGINAPKFAFIRTILQSPSWHKATMEQAKTLAQSIEFVDPYTFFMLLKRHEETKAAAQMPPLDRVSYSSPATREGMAPVRVADGPFTVVEESAVLRQEAEGKTLYLYFELADAFVRQFQQGKRQKARVRAVVTAKPGTRIAIHYDSHDAGPYARGPEAVVPESGQRVTLEWVIDRPAFQHGQNGGADFRLVNFGGVLQVHEIDVVPM